MGTIKIGSSSNRKGITINPKTVLFNGDNVKYIMSGLTEIWNHIVSLVPTMTSNTVPYGEAISNDNYGGTYPYYVFDEKEGESNWTSVGGANSWVGYKFTVPTCVKRAYFKQKDGCIRIKKYKIQASNNGSNWFDISEDKNAIAGDSTYQEITVDIDNESYYMYYRLFIIESNNVSVIWKLQFYGSQLKALIPNMTSNITPSGIVTCSSVYSNEYDSWKAFDGISSANGVGYAPSSTDKFGTAYVQYEFKEPKKAKTVGCSFRATSNSTYVYKLQASNDGKEFETLVESMEMKTPTPTSFSYYGINVDKAYKYYRFIYVSNSANDITTGGGVKFQLYG